jgi:cytochrome c oxidase cbb3-type subunit I/II
VAAMQTLGVPYTDKEITSASNDMLAQATEISNDLNDAGIEVDNKKEIVALIAYLQRLGTDIKVK